MLTRAYADWSADVNAGYRGQLVGRAVDLVQLFPAAAYGKNGADIRLAVDTVGTFYASQTPTFLQTVGSRLFLEYEAVLTSGEKLSAVVVVDRNADGSVPRVSVRMSPLGAVLTLATHLRGALSKQLPENLFL